MAARHTREIDVQLPAIMGVQAVPGFGVISLLVLTIGVILAGLQNITHVDKD